MTSAQGQHIKMRNQVPAVWGFATVYRNRMQARSAVRDLLVSVTVTGAVIWLSYLQASGMDRAIPDVQPLENGGDLLTRWAMISISIIGAVTALLAAVGAAVSVPTRAEFEPIQSSLLTQLRPIDICAGRLAAGLWLPLTMVLSSAAFWLAANIVAKSHGLTPQYAAVCGAHAAVMLFTLLMGSVAFLFSQKRRPGSSPVAGLSISVLTGAACVLGVWIINPIILKMDNPSRMIEAALAINPEIGIAAAFHIDILREDWLYQHLRAQDFLFAYPPVAVPCLLYSAAGFVAVWVSAIRTRLAFR